MIIIGITRKTLPLHPIHDLPVAPTPFFTAEKHSSQYSVWPLWTIWGVQRHLCECITDAPPNCRMSQRSRKTCLYGCFSDCFWHTIPQANIRPLHFFFSWGVGVRSFSWNSIFTLGVSFSGVLLSVFWEVHPDVSRYYIKIVQSMDIQGRFCGSVMISISQPLSIFCPVILNVLVFGSCAGYLRAIRWLS